MNNCCCHIDDYLDGDLTVKEQATWLLLAQDCPHCQAVLKQQREVDNLLGSAWSMVNPAACERPADKTTTRITRPSRPFVAGALAFAASVALIVLYVDRLGDRGDTSKSKPEEVVSSDVSPPKIVLPELPLRENETTVTSSQGIVVPIANDPNFTIVQFVPEFHASDSVSHDD